MKPFLSILLTCALIAVNSQAAAAEKNPAIEDFAFLAGYWKGTGFGGVSEEIWMPPSNGSMFGIFKQSSATGIEFTEYLEITRLNEKFVLRLKHFNPDFSGWEEKSDYVTFKLESVSANSAVFGGLSYTLQDAKTLRIELRLKQDDGQLSTEVFELTRGSLPNP